MKKPNLDRRKFIRASGLSFLGTSLAHSPLNLLFQGLLDGIVNSAHAQVAGTSPRTYLYLTLPGAPPGWMWSQFLTPYGSTGYVNNAHVGTRYVATNGVYTDTTYSTVNLHGLNVPHLWQFPVAAAGGGMRPMADLLPNLLSIQGISTGNTSHPGSRTLQMLPLGANQSVMAMSGDASNTPIPGVSVATQNYVYKSISGKGALVIPQVNTALNDIMDAFRRNVSAQFVSNRAVVDTVIEQAVSSLNAAAHSRHPAAAAISDNRANAKAVVASGLANFGDAWNTLVAKYTDLIRRSIDPSFVMAGINDLPIGAATGRAGTYFYGDNNVVTNTDLRSIFTANTNAVPIARTFAVIEYVLTNRLTSSFATSIPGFANLSINGQNVFQNFDEHSGGKMTSTLINAYLYRALSSCLLELIDQLKARGLFNQTVINIAGEFTRSPREDGTGSDHGWRGAHITAFSGIVRQPTVLGNIRNTRDRNYNGTWGEGGAINALNGATIDLGHSVSTLAALLGVPSPITAKPPLVTVQNDTVVPVIETTRIV